MMDVAAAVRDAEKLLVCGPDGARTRLVSYLREEAGSSAQISLEYSGKVTDGQLVARARARLA
jgi:hypothetical protein